MYGQYIAAVVSRAFQPTARITDIMQILAASAAPAIAKFLRLPVPLPEDTLAYIGAAALAFVALRLFFVAPYQVWREQVTELGCLKLELSKPEQIEHQRMAKLRAKSKLKLAALIREMYWNSCNVQKNELESVSGIERLLPQAIALMGQSAVGIVFDQAFALLTNYSFEYILSSKREHQFASHKLINDMLDFLHGKITSEALALRLPPDIVRETQR